jgi:hypothetical protein
MFCESIRKLVCEYFFKTAPAFVQRINPEFFGATIQFVPSVLIREIRGLIVSVAFNGTTHWALDPQRTHAA